MVCPIHENWLDIGRYDSLKSTTYLGQFSEKSNLILPWFIFLHPEQAIYAILPIVIQYRLLKDENYREAGGKDSYLVKGMQYEGLKKIGNINDITFEYSQKGFHELMFSDVMASLYGRNRIDKILVNFQILFVQLPQVVVFQMLI